jgi:diacylglycerol kinase family enzyme
VAEIMNIRHAGSRLHLAPDADIDDRLFDVVTVSMEQREGMLAWIKQGSDQTAPPLTVTRGREIVIDWRGDHLRIDDYGPDKSPHSGAVTIAFAPEQLEILVPSIVDREPPPPRR